MFSSLTKYLYQRRRGLAKATGVLAGAYMLGTYVADRLREIKDEMLRDKAAKDNLRRRFEQNQQDVSFMVMGLMSTLGEQVLTGMNVEHLTAELQSTSRAAASAPKQSGSAPQPQHIQEPAFQLPQPATSDAGSDTRSESSASVLEHEPENQSSSLSGSSLLDTDSRMASSSQSWVHEFTTSSSGSGAHSQDPSSSLSPSHPPIPARSVTSSSASASIPSTSSPPDTRSPSRTRTKAALWREIKHMAVTRALVSLYATALLALLTHAQLTLLARRKYVRSVRQMAREERRREHTAAFIYGAGGDVSGGGWMEEDGDGEERNGEEEELDDEAEQRYLTLSWWLLHVGWKDIGERVRRAVEEVFAGVSLKTELSAMDLHRLLHDVRRRVEHEVTFEGTERRIKFLSTLLPPTPETLHHILSKGGLRVDELDSPPSSLSSSAVLPMDSSPFPLPSRSHNLGTSKKDDVDFEKGAFGALLAETRATLASADFARVLEACLDRATDVLFIGLERHVFRQSTVSVPPSEAERDARGNGMDELKAEGPAQKVRLAGMLPGLARWSHLALSSLPNELVDAIADTPEMSTFCAIIFGGFEDGLQNH